MVCEVEICIVNPMVWYLMIISTLRYRWLYKMQFCNTSTSILTLADPGGVQMHPPFEGLLSGALSKSAQLNLRPIVTIVEYNNKYLRIR